MRDRRAQDGIDEQRVGAWLTEHVALAAPPFRYELITGGRSNLTYLVTDGGGRRLVLRRPPLGTLLATAHDVVREYRIAAALAGTPVPVAPALAVCGDDSINGAPFAVTGYVDGIVLHGPDAAAGMDAGARRATAFHLIDVLADLHAVDLNAVGLADLSRQDSYIERQVRRWGKQWDGSRTRDLPIIDEVENRLLGHVPAARNNAGPRRLPIRQLHRRSSRSAKWSPSSIGSCVRSAIRWQTSDTWASIGAIRTGPCLSPTTRRRAAASRPSATFCTDTPRGQGRDVARIEYYRGFAAWRLAVIAEGVASRHLKRHPEDTAALEASRSAVEQLAEFALASLDGPAT